MKYRRLSIAPWGLFATTMLAAAWPTLARAHFLMSNPAPRQPGKDGNKITPCGEGAGSAKPATAKFTFAPGEVIPIELMETTPHAGWFRIALDASGQDSLTLPTMADYAAFPNIPAPSTTTRQSGGMWILSDYIFPHRSAANNTKRTAMVTLPNVTCDNCTLQVIQVMTGGTYSGGFYFHCVDIKLAAAGGSGGAGGAGGAAAGGASGAGGTASAGGVSGQGGSGSGGEASTGGAPGTGGDGGTAGDNGAGGDGGTAGDTGEGGGDGGGGGDDPGDKRSSGGCSIAGSGTGGAGLLIALVFGLLAHRRRLSRG